jgi:hypothetical protein
MASSSLAVQLRLETEKVATSAGQARIAREAARCLIEVSVASAIVSRLGFEAVRTWHFAMP